jgi:two-component system chemotaxis response regulator CheY
MRQLICHALRKIEGIVLVEAADGAEALAKLDDIAPDVIVTDLNMPVMDGFELIERVHARPALAKVPIVVLTTEGAQQDQERAHSLEVAAYVTKPIRQDSLVTAVLEAHRRG